MNKTNIILLSSFSVLVLVGGIWYYLDQNKKAKAEEEAFLNQNLEANKKTKTQTKSSSSTKTTHRSH
jgi:cbb3-type cytochrome oxidase subunit 3